MSVSKKQLPIRVGDVTKDNFNQVSGSRRAALERARAKSAATREIGR
jgi:hypothetical protein